MRTPGHDIELVHGFLLSEGLIRSVEDIALARYCEGAVVSGESGFDENTYNVIDVTLAPGVAPPAASATRSFFTNSSCGVCGKASIEQLRAQSAYDVRADPTEFAAKVIVEHARLRFAHEQRSFDKTGGLHAAGLFTADGELLVAREDVGRHNAVDKVVGWALQHGRVPGIRVRARRLGAGLVRARHRRPSWPGSPVSQRFRRRRRSPSSAPTTPA